MDDLVSGEYNIILGVDLAAQLGTGPGEKVVVYIPQFKNHGSWCFAPIEKILPLLEFLKWVLMNMMQIGFNSFEWCSKSGKNRWRYWRNPH